MPAILFAPLVSSPETLGDGIVRLPPLRVEGYEVATHGLAILPRLQTFATGTVTANLVGTGIAVLPRFRAFANDNPGSPLGTYEGFGLVYLPRLAVAANDNALAPIPQAGNGIAVLPALRVAAVGFTNQWGTGVATLRLGAFGLEAAGNWAFLTLPALRTYGYQVAPVISNYVSLLQDPGTLYTFVGNTFYHTVTEAVAVTDTMGGTRSTAIQDTVAFVSSFGSSLHVQAMLADSAVFADALYSAYQVLASENVVLTEGVLPTVTAMMQVLDTLVLADLVTGFLQANVVVSTAIVLGETVTPSLLATLADNAAFVDSVLQTMLTVAAAVDAVALADTTVGLLRTVISIKEDVFLGDTASQISRLIARIDEGLVLTALMHLAGEEYKVWVMSPDNEAVYQYQGYNFNSFAAFGNTYYGANDIGLHRLEGNTDNGVPIAARVRTGLMDFGTGRLKQMSRAYLGYTSTGALLLKVVTIASEGSERGKKVEDWYELTRVHADMAEGRVPVGEGLKSVYWQFVLHNKAGAAFSADEVRLYPLISDRRIR